MDAERLPRTITTASDRQHGLVTAAQLGRLGVDAAVLADLTGRMMLTRLDWDVFEVAGSPTPPRYAFPYAAWLALKPGTFAWERPGADGTITADAVLSHESAARVLGLRSPSIGGITFTAPAPLPEPRGVRVVVAELRPDEAIVHQHVPVTTARRTVLDLVRAHTDALELRGVISDAVRLDLVDLAALHRDLAPLAGRYGFPAGGPDFVAWFVPALDADALSPRNARALATLLSERAAAPPGGQRPGSAG
jgi:hypothetical protein